MADSRVTCHHTARPIESGHSDTLSEGAFIQFFPVSDHHFFRMYVFPFLPLNNRIVRKNASGILPKGGSSHSDEHVSEEMRVVLSQLRTKFLNPADD